jgi:trans-aconitate methyltransferase
MDHDILHEQIAYYRARAQEYDETTEGTEDLKGAFARARDHLQQKGPFEQVLELACGTGTWTRILLPIGRDITAIDAAPEMLAIAQQKLGDAQVHYQHIDLFQWEPKQEYHLVFFANWLSHVPPQELDAFLAKVSRAVRPGGYVAIIDQYAPTPEDRQIMKEGEGGSIYAQRPLRDGKTFTIVKVFYNVMALQETFITLGFEVVVHQLSDIFFFLEARRH